MQNQNLRGIADRTFVGANSAISFEELSASEKASNRSLAHPASGRQVSHVQSNLSQMDSHLNNN